MIVENGKEESKVREKNGKRIGGQKRPEDTSVREVQEGYKTKKKKKRGKPNSKDR